MSQLEKIADEALKEAKKATLRYPPFNSMHEGYSVLYEEVDELWAEVKAWKMNNPDPENIKNLRTEAIHVAAMALRFIHDLCDEK
ncbi:MAG: hypothetical protein WC365_06425 [Candidatus Babeliales bacterium]|jgi:hypothetical protein